MSTQNSFTKIKSVLRFLAVCRTVLGGRNAHDGFENTVKTTLVNSVLLSIANLPLTIMMIVFHALPFIIVIWSLKFAPISILIGFAAVAYSNSIFLLKLFEKLQPQQEETQEDMQEQEVQADSDIESIVE